MVVVSTTVPGSSRASAASSDVLPPLPTTDVTPGPTPSASASFIRTSSTQSYRLPHYSFKTTTLHYSLFGRQTLF